MSIIRKRSRSNHVHHVSSPGGRRGLAFSVPTLSWLRCEVPREMGVGVGGRSAKLVFVPVCTGAGPCTPETPCFMLT